MLLDILCATLGGIIGGSIIFGGNILLYWYETKTRNGQQKELVNALKDAMKVSKGSTGHLAKVLDFKGTKNTPNSDKLN